MKRIQEWSDIVGKSIKRLIDEVDSDSDYARMEFEDSFVEFASEDISLMVRFFSGDLLQDPSIPPFHRESFYGKSILRVEVAFQRRDVMRDLLVFVHVDDWSCFCIGNEAWDGNLRIVGD